MIVVYIDAFVDRGIRFRKRYVIHWDGMAITEVRTKPLEVYLCGEDGIKRRIRQNEQHFRDAMVVLTGHEDPIK